MAIYAEGNYSFADCCKERTWNKLKMQNEIKKITTIIHTENSHVKINLLAEIDIK